MLKNKEVILWKMLFVRLSTMLLLLSFSRWLLYIFSTNNFNDLNLNELFRLYFVGFRFDIYTLIIFNIPLIFFYCIPSKIKYNHIENTVTYVDNGKLSTQNLNLNCSNIITE